MKEKLVRVPDKQFDKTNNLVGHYGFKSANEIYIKALEYYLRVRPFETKRS